MKLLVAILVINQLICFSFGDVQSTSNEQQDELYKAAPDALPEKNNNSTSKREEVKALTDEEKNELRLLLSEYFEGFIYKKKEAEFSCNIENFQKYKFVEEFPEIMSNLLNSTKSKEFFPSFQRFCRQIESTLTVAKTCQKNWLNSTKQIFSFYESISKVLMNIYVPDDKTKAIQTYTGFMRRYFSGTKEDLQQIIEKNDLKALGTYIQDLLVEISDYNSKDETLLRKIQYSLIDGDEERMKEIKGRTKAAGNKVKKIKKELQKKIRL